MPVYAQRRRGSLFIGLLLAAFAVVAYYSSEEYNPITGETQRVAISPDEEIAMGLQAAPEMAAQYGGLDTDTQAQVHVVKVGKRVLRESNASQANWKYQFNLLADTETVNAFALPGGQVFLTKALYNLLTTDAQLAGVLAHEIGHVAARHGAEHIAKQRLAQGLTGAAVVATGDQRTGYAAAMIGQLVNMKYGRGDELEADKLGVRFITEAGYDPRAMIDVMHILKKAEKTTGRPPEFFSTHPNPENRIAKIEEAIKEKYLGGDPEELEK